MLNFKKSSAIFLLLILLINLFNIFWGLSAWWYALPAAFLLAACTIGSFRIDLSFYFPVINHFDSKNELAITFDDGPDASVTPEVLRILEKHQVKATFFCIGRKAEAEPEIIKRILSEGHTIANHSYSHSYFTGFFSTKKLINDLEKCTEVIEKITGQRPKFFRPPFGVTNPNIKRAVSKLSLTTIGWSLRTLDTVSSAKKIRRRLKNTKAGNIVLFHDNLYKTPTILDEYLLFCNENGLKIEPLNKLINSKPYE